MHHKRTGKMVELLTTMHEFIHRSIAKSESIWRLRNASNDLEADKTKPILTDKSESLMEREN